MRWPRRRSPQSAVAAPRVPAVLVARHIRKAIGAPGVTAAAVGVAIGLLLGLALAVVLLTATKDTE